MSTPNIGPNWAVAVNIDQDALLARLGEEKNVNYVEKCLKPNFPWLQLSEGKLFCKVRNMGLSQNNFIETLFFAVLECIRY